MIRKSIAAALLIALVAWAEIASAPVLILHAWHGRLHTQAVTAHSSGHHHQAMPADHSCCPKVGTANILAAFELAATTNSCQNEHRCCFVQGTQNKPAPVRDGQQTSQSVLLEDAFQAQLFSAGHHHVSVAPVAPGPSPGLFSTVLRI